MGSTDIIDHARNGSSIRSLHKNIAITHQTEYCVQHVIPDMEAVPKIRGKP